MEKSNNFLKKKADTVVINLARVSGVALRWVRGQRRERVSVTCLEDACRGCRTRLGSADSHRDLPAMPWNSKVVRRGSCPSLKMLGTGCQTRHCHMVEAARAGVKGPRGGAQAGGGLGQTGGQLLSFPCVPRIPWSCKRACVQSPKTWA